MSGLEKMPMIRVLREDDLVDLHRCWIKAFSDYNVPFSVSLDELIVRLRQDSYCCDLSFGAFYEKQMVGFWLSGFRMIEDFKVAYDAGTAIVPEWRRCGLSNLLFSSLSRELKSKKIEQYIVEVFQNNKSAIEMYQKHDFFIKRNLYSFKLLSTSQLGNVDDDMLKLKIVDLNDVIARSSDIISYIPSWQNSWIALKEVADSSVSIIIERNNDVVGFAVLQPILRRIAQIGVSSEVNQCDVVNMILSYFRGVLHENVDIEIVNIPDDGSKIVEILKGCGFQDYATLIEMLRVME